MQSTTTEHFNHRCFYFLLDFLYVVFAILYNIGDQMDNGLKYLRAVPIVIMVVQLYTYRTAHRHITTIMVALLFGSIGDMCMLWGQYTIPFTVGQLAFLIGYIIYVTAFVMIAQEASQKTADSEKILSCYPLYLIIWLVLMTFSFFSISTVISDLSVSDQYLKYVLNVYGTVLTLLTMGGFFIYFVASRASSYMYWASLSFMFGALILYASDNFLVHGKYNTWYKERVSKSTNSYLIMITYYVGLFLIEKGAYYVGRHFVQHGKQVIPVISTEDQVQSGRH